MTLTKKNNNATRTYSDIHENSVCEALGGKRSSNSGAGHFVKGDVITNSNILIECKTSMSEKSSFSIKKEWIEKNRHEAFENRCTNSVISFRFEPFGDNFYVIDEKLMKFLSDKLIEENK